MGKYANFYDGVRKLLDKVADALDPDSADVKTANYQTAVLNSLERIGEKVSDVVDATLPDPSTATDGDTLVVDDGEWVIGSGGGGGGGGALVCSVDLQTGALDKTWKEIHDAYADGKIIVCDFDSEGELERLYLGQLTENTEAYGVVFYELQGEPAAYLFSTDTENDYPVLSGD